MELLTRFEGLQPGKSGRDRRVRPFLLLRDEVGGIENVTITLSGQSVTGATLNVLATTDATGLYTFSGTAISDATGYTLTVSGATLPSGYLTTKYNTSGALVLGTGASNNISVVFR